MQTDNPFLDGMARLFTDAAGAAQSVRAEIEGVVRQRMEKLVADMNLVPREEFEAVKAMAAKARAEKRGPWPRASPRWKPACPIPNAFLTLPKPVGGIVGTKFACAGLL